MIGIDSFVIKIWVTFALVIKEILDRCRSRFDGADVIDEMAFHSINLISLSRLYWSEAVRVLARGAGVTLDRMQLAANLGCS